MAAKSYDVRAYWDDEAQCWWAESDDIPGLVSEAATLDDLIARIIAVAPELLAANMGKDDVDDIPIHVIAERTETARRAG